MIVLRHPGEHLKSLTEQRVYDGANIIEETDGSGSVLSRYTLGLGIDEPLAMFRDSVTHYYQADGLGSVTGLGDSSGTLAASNTYDSFGNLTASSGSLTNPFRYTARESDSDTGLYYYRARYYSQEAGRFISEDLIGVYTATFISGGNLYSYVRNNPVVLVDPSGLQFRRDTPGGEAPYDLLRDFQKKRANELERGQLDPVLDVFVPCFTKCMLLGFIDDIAAVGSSLFSKRVRQFLTSPRGKCVAKWLGIAATIGAGGFCTSYCKNKTLDVCPPCQQTGRDQ